MNEKVLVHYRELQCIACNHMTSWIEFRLPNYCPECGKHIFLKLKFDGILVEGKNVWIEMELV